MALSSFTSESVTEGHPDGKTQVTVEFENGVPQRIPVIVVAAQHAENVTPETIREGIIAERCEIQVAYVIGIPEPVSLFVETFGTGRLPDDALARLVGEAFDFRPGAVIERLDLRKPIYRQTAAYGHFGRPEFSWEHPVPLSAANAPLPERARARTERRR